jgi:hypothetical protein
MSTAAAKPTAIAVVTVIDVGGDPHLSDEC